MALVWALGGLLVVLGVVLVGASLLRRGGAAENPTLGVVSGLVMTGLGVVAISAAALAGDPDSGDDGSGDQVAATGTTGPEGGSGPAKGGDGEGGGGDSGGTGGTGGDRSGRDPSGEPEPEEPEEHELPVCFDRHLSDDPVVAEDDHLRLEEGVDQQLLITMHAADAIALELVEDGELLAVMRVGDQAVPADDTLHVYDVVDVSCQPVAFTPQDTDDDVAQNHRTVVPLQLAGRSYEVDFLQTGLTPELDVIFRRVP